MFRIDWERSLTMIPLAEENPTYFIRGGDLHPDGRTLFYRANSDLTTCQEIEPPSLIRHDPHTGDCTTLARPAKPFHT